MPRPVIGDKIVWSNFLDGSTKDLRRGTVTKAAGELVWVNNQHKAEDCIYADFTWPARVETELLLLLAKRSELKKAYDDSIGLIYELRNAISRGEK